MHYCSKYQIFIILFWSPLQASKMLLLHVESLHSDFLVLALCQSPPFSLPLPHLHPHPLPLFLLLLHLGHHQQRHHHHQIHHRHLSLRARLLISLRSVIPLIFHRLLATLKHPMYHTRQRHPRPHLHLLFLLLLSNVHSSNMQSKHLLASSWKSCV